MIPGTLGTKIALFHEYNSSDVYRVCLILQPQLWWHGAITNDAGQRFPASFVMTTARLQPLGSAPMRPAQTERHGLGRERHGDVQQSPHFGDCQFGQLWSILFPPTPGSECGRATPALAWHR